MWQPIETAPKDGTEVLVYTNDGMQVAWCIEGSWYCTLDSRWEINPTHWQPLPLPPGEG